MLSYSLSTGGFYDTNFHFAENIPADVVEITEEQHESMLGHLNSGGKINLDGAGRWIFVSAAPDEWHFWNEQTNIWETNAELQAAKLQHWRETVQEITPKQLRLVLLANGVTSSAVESAIISIEDEITRETAMIEWQYGAGYQRTNANLVMIATQLLGLTEEQIDAMWSDALTK